MYRNAYIYIERERESQKEKYAYSHPPKAACKTTKKATSNHKKK